MDMMLYPIGIQNFEDLRCNEYVYVDKTEHIHNLVSTGKYYFLSRPRRFGKSLLLSTIEAYFQGKREMFTGLAIEKMEARYADICGISENDLHKYFSESVAALAQANGMGIDECFDKLRQMYDGYHFSEKSDRIPYDKGLRQRVPGIQARIPE